MEPERKIEKLLRAYAKKRRAQAGDSLKLHPADRQILHGEILQHAPKPCQNIFSAFMLTMLQPKIGYLWCFAVLVLVAGSLLVVLNPAQTRSKADRSSYRELAKASSTISGGAKKESVQNESRVDRLAAGGSIQTATPAASSVESAVVVPQQASQRNDVSGLPSLFRNASVSAQATTVLQSFRVQQNGNAISIVDKDESVYSGSVQLSAATVQEEPIPAKSFAPSIAPPQSRMKADQSAGNEQQAAQNYFFRVAGTNRTLRQNVVFTGNVQAISNVPATVQQILSDRGNFGASGSVGGQNNQPVAANQLPQGLLSNSRIIGTAVIDSTNQIEINAVPVTP